MSQTPSLAHGPAFLDAADVEHLSSLTQLTHLDLGHAKDVIDPLLLRLPNLQSLALRLPQRRPSGKCCPLALQLSRTEFPCRQQIAALCA